MIQKDAIKSPESPQLDSLCESLRDQSTKLRSIRDWPATSLKQCADAGVYRWFLPESEAGFGWNAADQTRGYLRLAAADLVTTFVITQYMGACRRILSSENPLVADRWLADLVSGAKFGTVGISHLTTSRRHLSKPVLAASQTPGGFRLNGMSPWVTGGGHADVVVVGATLPDNREILAAVPTTLAGVQAGDGIELVALSASCTDKVVFDDVLIDQSMLIAGPEANVMQGGSGARTGGLQTSTLAAGLARAACQYLETEALKRDDLREASAKLLSESNDLCELLIKASDDPNQCDPANVRSTANDLVIRTTSAALMAAKGAGFVEGHVVGKWCREALFFLVWSCPQPVAQAHLCDLAGIA